MKTSRYSDSQIMAILKTIKKRKIFPSDDTARKTIYLAIQGASKK